MKWSLVFISIFTLFFIKGDVALAQTVSGLTVNPVFQEVTLEGTKAEPFSVAVTNGTDVLVTLRVSVLDFGSLDESGGVAFLGAQNDFEKKYALAAWMQPEKDTLTLRPGETQSVRVTVENRDSLSPGGHYAALVFKAGDDTGSAAGENSIAVNQYFSTLVFVKKIGGEIYRMDLKDFDYAPKNLFRFPRKTTLRFQNSGNVHLTPRGTVTVADPLGRTVAKGIVNEESALILPESLRLYPVTLKGLAANLIPGRYTLMITSRYDGREGFDTESTRFFFVPPLAIVLVLGIAVIAGWCVWRWRKKSQKK